MTNNKKISEITETQEEYIKIYHEYFVLNWTWPEICEYHQCCKAKVSSAISWVIKNKIKLPAKTLLKGAIDAISVRLKNNKKLYNVEVNKKRNRNNKFIIGMTKEIREDEKMLYELQEVYKEDEGQDETFTNSQILQLIMEAHDQAKKSD